MKASIDATFEYFHKRSPKASVNYLNQGQLPDSYQALEKARQAIADADPTLTAVLRQHASGEISVQPEVKRPPEAIMVNLFGDVSQVALERKIGELVTDSQFETAETISFDLNGSEASGSVPASIQMRLYVE